MRDVGCPYCGTLEQLSASGSGSILSCSTCRSELERTLGKRNSLALGCAFSGLLLLIPGNLLPFLSTSVLGVSRHSVLASGAVAMWRDGWALLAIMIGLFVVALPLARFALLTAVLGALQLGRRPPWLGRAFRWANTLQQWAMADVFLLGLWIAYARLSATIDVDVGPGAYCFIAAGILSLVMRATLDRNSVWRLTAPDTDLNPGPVCSCLSCDFIVPARDEGRPCPRCGDKVNAREPNSLVFTIALTLAGVLLYIPANALPIATLPIGLHPTKYNVLEGVVDLAKSGLFGLAALVFCASFAIPILKLAGLSYCVASVVRRSQKRLILKTRIYRIVEEAGRWSMVDPFVIACFVPVVQYNSLIYGRAEPAAPAFASVVVITMIAARAFDPRLMWDAALGQLSSVSKRATA